jgi:hypothetical protein
VQKLGDRLGDFSQMLRAKEEFPWSSLMADVLQDLPQVRIYFEDSNLQLRNYIHSR